MTGELIRKIRQLHPVVHCITNFVTANDCANLLLAAGASPTMAEAPEEMAEIVTLANALCVNIGTLSDSQRRAISAAVKQAKKLCRPAVLDPVGAGASKLRTDTALALLETGAFSLLRGNVSEIRAIAGVGFSSRGVDASQGDALIRENLPEILEFTRVLARKYRITVAISGASDLIADADRAALVRNGDPIMPLITGSGCMLSSLCGAALAAEPDSFQAALGAFAAMGICGETARARLAPDEGNATCRNYLIDAMYHLTPTQMEGNEKIDLL